MQLRRKEMRTQFAANLLECRICEVGKHQARRSGFFRSLCPIVLSEFCLPLSNQVKMKLLITLGQRFSHKSKLPNLGLEIVHRWKFNGRR